MKERDCLEEIFMLNYLKLCLIEMMRIKVKMYSKLFVRLSNVFNHLMKYPLKRRRIFLVKKLINLLRCTAKENIQNEA